MKKPRAQIGLVIFAVLNVVVGAVAVSSLLPVGDGKVSSEPKIDSVFACSTRFGGGGAFKDGPWIQGSSWNPELKISIQGAVKWDSKITVSLENSKRMIRSNNLPDHATGIFPVASADPAYQYDRNPNKIKEQNILLELPATPTAASSAGCVPMGMIGFTLSGAAIYNALDAQGRDAGAHEIQDSCSGHPERSGQYHYHDLSRCFVDSSKADQHSTLVGYALDGFGFYGLQGENGEILENSDLDACHGHTHVVDWDGQKLETYHYHFTNAYPYTIGCYKGTPVGSSE
jgi:YHYH protein